MSLEQALAANTAAVTEHNELLKKVLAAGGKSTATGTTATAGKPTTTTAKATGAKKVTEEELKKTATTFLGTKDEEERANRKIWVGKICELYGVPKLSEAPPDKWADIVRMLKQLTAGDTPPELVSEETEAGEEEDSQI